MHLSISDGRGLFGYASMSCIVFLIFVFFLIKKRTPFIFKSLESVWIDL